MLSRNVSTAPFGPVSTFSTLARRHSALMATILSRCCTSSGNGPKRSASSAPNDVDLALVVDVGEPAIEAEPHREVGDVVLRDQHRHADGDLRRPAVGGGLGAAGLHHHHGLFQHLLVKLEADLLDVAGLLLAEQIAGAADVEIVRGKLEARAERIERLEHLEPPLGLVVRRLFAGSVNSA